jgi:hypothetical protein
MANAWVKGEYQTKEEIKNGKENERNKDRVNGWVVNADNLAGVCKDI